MKISDLLNEADEPKLKIGDIDPRNGKKILSAMTDSQGYVVRSGTGDIWNVKYGEPDKKPDAEPVAPPAAEPTPAEQPAAEPAVVSPVKEPDSITSTDVPPAADDKKPEGKPAEKCGPDVKEKIKQQKTFNAAYKMAKDAGCPDFDWCQIVDVPGQAPSPQPAPVQGVTTNPMGDFDPTAFSGDFTKVREDLDEEEFLVPESAEIHRMREIAGTQVVYEAETMSLPKKYGDKGIPEIKAANKQAAIEIAKKKGIKRFKFCGKFKVKSGGQAPSPKPRPKPPVVPPKTAPQGVTTNPMGDFDPTAFSGDFTRTR